MKKELIKNPEPFEQLDLSGALLIGAKLSDAIGLWTAKKTMSK